jgi:hypothetical protein
MLEDGAHEDAVAVADVRVHEAQGAGRQLSVEEEDDLGRRIQDIDDLGKKRSGRGEGVRHKQRWKKKGERSTGSPRVRVQNPRRRGRCSGVHGGRSPVR